ncbi:MAG: multicopper oxidase domain-containing protein [Candidatus Limnocylindria bacterium]
MDTTTTPDPPLSSPVVDSSLTRRGFLRGAALAGGGLIAAGLAACTPAAGAAGWTFGPGLASGDPAPSGPAPTPAPSDGHSMAPTAAPSAAPSAPTGLPAGWSSHDDNARRVVRRYLGNLVTALPSIYPEPVVTKLAGILGVEDDYPELGLKPAFAQVPNLVLSDAVSPLTPTLDGDVKVFNLTVDEMEWRIDELLPPVAALGYNAQWPGPTIRVNQGDRVRAIFRNHLKETTSVHFHGVEFDDFFQDGVPFVTQRPIIPGEDYAYEFTAVNAGSHMYHSHHNATDQVGRGLLGAFIVDPPTPQAEYDREYVWISNDTLGGFTINGHGFPAVVPVVAALGEKVLVRFMNEGIMMHPWHSHGFAMDVVARDGIPLGSAGFRADTFGVNPGERWDAVISADRLGVWAFHCHILPHVEGPDGMFGMVTTLIVVPEKAHVDAIIEAVLA